MGRSTRGVYPDKDGSWQVDKVWRGARFRQRGFQSFEEANQWLIKQLDERRAVVLHGERVERVFDQAAVALLLDRLSSRAVIVQDQRERQ